MTAFRKKTKALSVSGYRKSPEWIESSALDMMLIANLLYFGKPAKVRDWLEKNCSGLVEKYGFIINFRTKA